MGRHLIGLIDGTMVSASRTPDQSSYSNVFELACLLQVYQDAEDGSSQIVFYTSGISSQPDNSSLWNLATGNSIMSQIIDQYTDICANYDFDAAKRGDPDKIYLFGFSRGAMAVRALAGLIAEFGLLEPEDIGNLPRVLDAWDRSEGRGNLKGKIRLRPAEVEFVGLFDSVMGGVEWLRLFNPIRFKNLAVPARCRTAIQILAIDENRPHFKHKFWDGIVPRKGNQAFETTRALRQIWMPGVHSDIGGTGNPIWGNAALLAMIHYIRKHTVLAFKREQIEGKEEVFRHSIADAKYFISPHGGLFNRYRRRPIGSKNAQEYHHPVCSVLEQITYAGREKFDWRDQVFNRRFAKTSGDAELDAYFARVLTFEASPPTLAVVPSEVPPKAWGLKR